jgi:hypothetical protein
MIGLIANFLRPCSGIFRSKSANESVISSTTLQDDDQLLFPIKKNEKWIAEFFLTVGTDMTVHGVKLAVTVPPGATLRVTAAPAAAQGTLAVKTTTASGAALDFTNGDFLVFFSLVHISVSVLNGGNAGNVTLQYAQSTSAPIALTVFQGSHVLAFKIH